MRTLLTLLAALISMELPAQESRTLNFKVHSVLDGSTIRGIHTGEAGEIIGGTYRLLGVLAPIKNEEQGIEQPHWNESKKHLSKIIGFKVKATSEYVDGKEYWNISLRNGHNINLEMVKSGHAWHQPAHGRFPRYFDAQNQARDDKRGLWSRPNPVEPWNYEQHLKDEAARKAVEAKAVANRKAAESAKRDAEDKARAVNALLKPLGGTARLRNLQRAKISIAATATGIEASGRENVTKIQGEVFFELAGIIVVIFEIDDRRTGGVISLIKGDERLFGLEKKEIAPVIFLAIRDSIKNLATALLSPRHDGIVVGKSDLEETGQAFEIPVLRFDEGVLAKAGHAIDWGGKEAGAWTVLHVADTRQITGFDVQFKLPPPRNPNSNLIAAMLMPGLEGFQKPVRFFLDRARVQKFFKEQPGWSESVRAVYLLDVETISLAPFTEKDNALFDEWKGHFGL